MPAVVPMPRGGDVYLDPRGSGRALRVTWHHDVDVVVLSLWRDNTCAGTFRLPRQDVPDLVNALVCGLAEGQRSHVGGRATTAC